MSLDTKLRTLLKEHFDTTGQVVKQVEVVWHKSDTVGGPPQALIGVIDVQYTHVELPQAAAKGAH